MTTSVCVSVPESVEPGVYGGHLWAFLNWVLGFQELGCRVFWLDIVRADAPLNATRAAVGHLRSILDSYQLSESLVLAAADGKALPGELGDLASLDMAVDADLLVNFRYGLPHHVLRRFRRTALIDIDPGQLQLSLAHGFLKIPHHDLSFTIGEGIGSRSDLDREWLQTRQCVSLRAWPIADAPTDAPFTTISHWYMEDWIVEADGTYYRDDKREGFLPFIDLPQSTAERLELALYLGGDEVERRNLEARGWSVKESATVAPSCDRYRNYIARSKGEFSCAKPHYVRMANAWVSDRTLCYLASGKPAVVQHTGPSAFLPEWEGMLRFRTYADAVRALNDIARNYKAHCQAARQLAEDYFDASVVAGRLLERAL